ncbi:MAG: type III polyketide synthase [Acidobacteria bacterium]|nr:type III polyketide synthase [Acidobacteriota bacterium]
MTQAFINRIATAVPDHEVHFAFVEFASMMLKEERSRTLFLRMAAKSGINRRFSVLRAKGSLRPGDVDAHAFYRPGQFPCTAERMRVFEENAPRLVQGALDRLALTDEERQCIRHVIVTCCTGHYAPGLDFAIIDHLGLSSEVERTMIGFMGCYAAINGLKQARHIVRSERKANVLLVNLELCTLHLQESQDLAEVLSFLVFGDGCSASLISAKKTGLAMDGFRAVLLPETRDLITWRIGDGGFLMHLSGQVPTEIEKALRSESHAFAVTPQIDLWAIHPGGRTVLDAVESGLLLPPYALAASRKVLLENGNMSSATVMFVLAELMKTARDGQRGIAMSFGPGLTAETMAFHAV